MFADGDSDTMLASPDRPYAGRVSDRIRDDWGEEEYLRYLHDERRSYAWVMRRYGDLDAARADAAALERYPYEPADAHSRSLVFHDEAWHWAMLDLHGAQYWVSHPHLATPSAEYRALG